MADNDKPDERIDESDPVGTTTPPTFNFENLVKGNAFGDATPLIAEAHKRAFSNEQRAAVLPFAAVCLLLHQLVCAVQDNTACIEANNAN